METDLLLLWIFFFYSGSETRSVPIEIKELSRAAFLKVAQKEK